MSHFTVIVIGDDVEGQMAPYDEQIQATPRKVHLKADEVKRMRDYYGKPHLNDDGSTTPAKLKKRAPLKDFVPLLSSWVGDGGGLDKKGLYYMSTYNEDSKWDWYQIGGRWRGYFKLKPGRTGLVGEPGVGDNDYRPGTADQCLFGDIDMDAMIEEERQMANSIFDVFETALAGRKLPPTWEATRKKYKNIDKARKVHNENPIVKDITEAFNKAGHFYMFEDPIEIFKVGRKKYVEGRVSSFMTPYAVVKDGEWYQKGQMGWWGMSSGDMKQSVWDKKFMEMLKGLPDDTLITLVDCHI